MADDVYDDPDNILAKTDDTVDGATELPLSERGDMSQSIYVPERANDERGKIDELDSADVGDTYDEMSNGHPEDTDTDANHPANMDPQDENDGTGA
jgi:hypothetical protein